MSDESIDFELLRRSRTAGYTPSRADVPRLIDALLTCTEARDARVLERALARQRDTAVESARMRMEAPDLPDRARARLISLLSRLQDPESIDAVAALLDHKSPRVRRQAALGLARFKLADSPTKYVEPLAARLEEETDASVARAIVDSLGKLGGDRATDALNSAEVRAATDREMSRVLDRARLTATRDAQRWQQASIDLTRSSAEPVALRLRCRSGLEEILAEELTHKGWTVHGTHPGRVDTELVGPLSRIFEIRTHHRVGFPLPVQFGATEPAVAAALVSKEAQHIFSSFTQGAVHYRLAWSKGGHRRAEVWRIAGLVADLDSKLVNDPTQSNWQARVLDSGRNIHVELEPRGAPDPRFSYRTTDVPAASHPTIAAALARISYSYGSTEDRVWDPFVGSGTELIERAKLAPVRAMCGTDTEQEALLAASSNADAAGVTLSLVHGDARQNWPEDTTCIITNPPMGRRVATDDLDGLLFAIVDGAGSKLPAQGTLCWISPRPEQTLARAKSAGMVCLFRQTVDMGGFWAEIQVFGRGSRDRPA